jgi:putative ABC transport system substrate-binding protein
VFSTPAALAAKAATTTIPVVMAASADPVGGGVIQSLSHPGGNITGLALMNTDLTAKRVEILKQLWPSLTWLGTLRRGMPEIPDRRPLG